MDGLLTTGLLLGFMGIIVLVFRLLVRRPTGVTLEDPPGVRTVAVFSGDDAELFATDRSEDLVVGRRLFEDLCRGLAAGGIGVEHPGTLENAQRVECVVETRRFALVLEWFGERWALSVEWCPHSQAERRHLAWTHQVFSPPDSCGLRRLLAVIDDWLKNYPRLSHVEWHRKERWFAEDDTEGAALPFAAE